MSKKINRRALMEACEPRQFFSSTTPIVAVDYPATLPKAYQAFNGFPMEDGHVERSEFIAKYTKYKHSNLWDPKVFNKTNSNKPDKWSYDPHMIVDDRPVSEQVPPIMNPITPRGNSFAAVGAVSTAYEVLPDFYPTMNGTAYMDRTQIAGRTIVRFGTQVNNQGLGPGILVGGPTNPDGTQQVFQRVYNYDPSTRALVPSYDRLAGNFTYHPTHSHIHFDGYAKYRLLANNNGVPGAQVVRPDGQLAEAAKVGFCLINVNSSFTLPSGQSSTTLTTYGASGMPSTSCGQFQGVLPGRADVYSASLADQWIDVTGVPDGTYFVEITLDARNGMLESNESNNVGTFAVTITGNGSGPILADRFEPNDTLATATNLGATGTSTVSGMTIHTGGNNDYYKFTGTSTGSAATQLYFTDGDLDLYIYNSAGTLISSSTATGVATTAAPRTETVTTTLTEGATYYARVVGKSSTTVSRAYELRFNNLPKVTMSTPDNAASEAGDRGSVAFTRNGPALTGLTVNFTVSGTATRGTDYDLYYQNAPLTGNTLIIGADASTATLEIVPKSDAIVEPTESVIVALNTSTAYVSGSPTSGTVNITDAPTVTIPSAPTILGALFDSNTGGVSVSWTDVANETSYAVQWRYQGWIWNDLATTAANVTSYLDLNAVRNTTIEYQVKAINSAGSSAWSNVASVLTSGSTGGGGGGNSSVNAPTGLSATAPNRWQVHLAWADNATNETGYKIQRRVTGTTTWSDLGEIYDANTTSIDDWSVWSALPGTSFDYQVIAVGPTSNSTPSNIATIVIPA